MKNRTRHTAIIETVDLIAIFLFLDPSISFVMDRNVDRRKNGVSRKKNLMNVLMNTPSMCAGVSYARAFVKKSMQPRGGFRKSGCGLRW